MPATVTFTISSLDAGTQVKYSSANVGTPAEQFVNADAAGLVTLELSNASSITYLVTLPDGQFARLPVTTATSSVSVGTIPIYPDGVPVGLRDITALFVSAFGEAGDGDVVGPVSSVDNAIARFDGTSGKTIQNSAVTIADTTGAIAGARSIALSGLTSGSVNIVVPAVAGTNTLTVPASTGTVALTSQLAPFTAASASGAASLAFAEDTDNGAHAVTVKAPDALAADAIVELPGVAGTLMRTAEVLRAYQTNSLSKTNSTFADTELSVTVEASGKYQFELYGFFTQPNATGGVKFDLNGGAATLTSGLLQWLTYQSDDNTVDATGLQTALADTYTPGFAPESEKTFFISLLGTMDVNAAGTVIPRFAQSVTDASACVFLAGSSLVMVKL